MRMKLDVLKSFLFENGALHRGLVEYFFVQRTMCVSMFHNKHLEKLISKKAEVILPRSPQI